MLAGLMACMTSACSSTSYPPPQFEQKVDVSKPGVLYETDFSVPYNGTFAPMKLEFGVPHTQYELVLRIADAVPGRLEQEQKEADEIHRKTGVFNITHTTLWKIIGFWGDIEYFDKLSVEQLKTHVRPMKYPGAPIQLRITLTPHPGTHKPIEYITARDHGTGHSTLLAPDQSLVAIFDLSSFAQIGGGFGIFVAEDKLLLLFPNLQLRGNYHLRIENLTPITLPLGIETTLIQRQARIAK